MLAISEIAAGVDAGTPRSGIGNDTKWQPTKRFKFNKSHYIFGMQESQYWPRCRIHMVLHTIVDIREEK